MTNFRFFQIERVFSDNYKFNENGSLFSKQVEITMGKGEITCHEHFLFFSVVFSKDLYCKHVKTMACLGKG